MYLSHRLRLAGAVWHTHGVSTHTAAPSRGRSAWVSRPRRVGLGWARGRWCWHRPRLKKTSLLLQPRIQTDCCPFGCRLDLIAVLLHSSNVYKEQSQSDWSVYYATVKAEGAPIVDSVETDVIPGRATALIPISVNRVEITHRDDCRECGPVHVSGSKRLIID